MCYDTTSNSVPSPSSEPSCEASVFVETLPSVTLVTATADQVDVTLELSKVSEDPGLPEAPPASPVPESVEISVVDEESGKEKREKKDLPTCALCQAQVCDMSNVFA